jgi:hypothetical protein
MKHNKKTILLILITITTLILLSTASATTDTNTTTTSSIKEKTTTTEPVVKEKIEKSATKELKTDKTQDKTITKTNKTQENTKTSTKTVEVTDSNSLMTTFEEAKTDTNHDTYTINLNGETYNLDQNFIWESTGNVKTIIINGNGNTINGTMVTFRITADHALILNNLTLYRTRGLAGIINQGDLTINQTSTIITPNNAVNNQKTLKYINSTINYKISNTIEGSSILIIDDDCILGENFEVTGNGQVITNLTGSYEGNKEINNENITKEVTILVTGNITLTNCQINAKITNQGNLTLINCSLSNNNMTTTGSKTDGFLVENKGNLAMIDCVVENNSFEITGTSDSRPSGVIVNQKNAILSVNNTIFRNNTNTGLENSLIYNLGIINSLKNCTVTDNNILFYLNKVYQYYQTEYNPDEFVLNVTDSLFENNSYNVFEAINMSIKDSSFYNNKYIYLDEGQSGGGTGPTGIAITATNLNVDNCTFDANGIISKHQYVDKGEYGGAISTTNLTVNNSRFTNNIVNTTSTWTTRGGSGAAIYTINGEITNSLFENNTASNPSRSTLPTIGRTNYGQDLEGELKGSAADIYSKGTIKIINNTFTNSYARNQAGSIYAYVKSIPRMENNITITDNTFTNTKSSQDTIIIEQGDVQAESIITLENNTYNNITINSEVTWNIPNKVYVNDTITATYNIINPEFYDSDLKDKITLDIYVDSTYLKTVPANEEISTIFNESGQHLVVIKPSITSDEYFTVISLLEANDIIITPENYDTYIYRNQLIRATKDSRVFFQGEFNNKEELLIQTNDITIDGSQATFTNTQFTIEANNTEIKNLNIQNTQSNNYAIYNTGNNNNITNNNIIMKNTEGRTTGIYNQANNTIIANNTISIDGPAASIDYSTELGIADTQAILLIGGDKNKVEYNKILVTSTQTSSKYGTIEGITNHKNATNTLISYNNVTVTGKANFNYAINSLGNVENITISYNNILVTGERYCDGIQVGSGAKQIYIRYNNITCHCHNTTPLEIEEALSYGIVTTSMGFENSEKIHIALNNINLTGTVNYGIEIYRTDETNVIYNNITANGTYSMGIGYSHSMYGWPSKGSLDYPYVGHNIMYNKIRLIGNSTKQINLVTEELQPENVGILIQQDSDKQMIEDNHINVNDIGCQDTTIKIKSNNQTISGNYGRTRTKIGNDTLYLEPGLENIVLASGTFMERLAFLGADQIYTTLDFTIPENTIVNHTVTIEIILTDDYGNQPLKTEETIRLNIQINNETPQTLVLKQEDTYTYTPTTPGEYNITIKLPETTTYYPSTQTKTLTILPKPVSHTNTTTENITPGDSTTLTAQFYDDDDQQITSGKVIFKVNGKTIRDNNGNVIYAEIVDGQATLPDVNITQEWMKPDTTIQAVYVGNDNNEPITTKPTTVTVTKPEATIILDAPTEATAGTTITLKATVTDGENNINSGRVAFKLNGKTLKDPKTGKALYAEVRDGVATITYTIPEKTKAKTYNLTAVFTDTAYDRKEASAELEVAKA